MASFKEQWEAAPLWQRVIVVLILPAVLVGAIWFYVIKPDMETRDRLVSQREQLKQEIAKYRRLIRPQVIENLKKQLEELKKKEEEKRKELEKVVGDIPTQEEIEKVFGEINSIALSNNLVITRIAISQPRVKNFQLTEKDGKKMVKLVAAQPEQRRGRRTARRGKKQQQPQAAGVPVTTMEVAMSLEGTTRSVYGFLGKIYEKGLVSYPKSVKIKPLRDRGLVSADVVIDVILQK